ncbi:MAG: NTP/NDP exchange transporter [Silvanigrellaceae bacterium]|nr:NTP/NDP exchange transporter [Silvanigrellaceae bacterium]
MKPQSGFFKNLILLQKGDLKIFIPMSSLMFLLVFNYICIHTVNDSLIVPNIGAEILPYLDFFGVLPFAVIFSIFYIRFCNNIGPYRLFSLILLFYAAFFLLYIYVIFPYEETLHPDPNFIAHLIEMYPFAKWILMAYGKYTYSLFHIIAEIWPTVCIVVIFWQFANGFIQKEQAKRLYPLFTLVGNIGLVAAGVCVKNVSEIPILENENHVLIVMLLKIVTLVCLMSIVLHYFICKVLIQKRIKIANQKFTLSLRESLKIIYSSRYLMSIFALVLCYGISINISQNAWKSELREIYPSTDKFAYFYGLYNQWLGILTITFMLLGTYIIKNLKWKTIALVPVFFTFLFTSLFYGIMFVDYSIDRELFYVKTLTLAAFAGGLSYIFTKATKYSFFDISKEMAYLPLEDEIKTKGKAAIDAISERLGKGIGAFLQAALFFTIPSATYQSLSGFLLLIHLAICYYWYVSVQRLDKEMKL